MNEIYQSKYKGNEIDDAIKYVEETVKSKISEHDTSIEDLKDEIHILDGNITKNDDVLTKDNTTAL